MSILAKSFKINFTQVPNEIINDKRVSLKAKGLYLYFISKPDNWDFSLSGMCSQLKESRPSVIKTIDELCSFGYLEKIKNRLDGKQAVNDYILHQSPIFPSESRNVTQKMRLRKTDSENFTTSNTNKNKNKISNTLSSSDERDFFKFKEDFIKENKNKLFTTNGIGWLPDTQFKINDQNYIYNTVSQKLLNREDAFKVWQYLYYNSQLQLDEKNVRAS